MRGRKPKPTHLKLLEGNPGRRPIQGADRLSDFETLMWTLDRDPLLTSAFANISLLDRPADVHVMRDGSLLVAGEQMGAIYRITYRR